MKRAGWLRNRATVFQLVKIIPDCFKSGPDGFAFYNNTADRGSVCGLCCAMSMVVQLLEFHAGNLGRMGMQLMCAQLTGWTLPTLCLRWPWALQLCSPACRVIILKRPHFFSSSCVRVEFCISLDQYVHAHPWAAQIDQGVGLRPYTCKASQPDGIGTAFCHSDSF